MFLNAMIVLFVLGITCPYAAANTYQGLGSVSFAAVLSVTAVTIACVTKTVSDRFLFIVMCCLALVIIVLDLHMVSELAPRMWPIFVLLLDFLLVVEVSGNYDIILVSIAVSWILITGAEMHGRFGLFDMPGLTSAKYRSEIEDCSSPPCSRPIFGVIATSAVQSVIFLMDYYFTRGFASQVLAEKSKIQASIVVAEEVSHCLGAFNLEAAEEKLGKGMKNLPPELGTALNVILSNLKMYRPYLPQSCLPLEEDQEEESSVHISNLPSNSGSDRESARESIRESARDGSARYTPTFGHTAIMRRGHVSLVLLNVRDSMETLETSITSYQMKMGWTRFTCPEHRRTQQRRV